MDQALAVHGITMDRASICHGATTMVQVSAAHGTIADLDQALAAHGITMDRTSVCPWVITGVIIMVQVSARLVMAAAGAGKI